MSYHVLSYPIISYHVLSCPIISYHIISYPIISYHILSYPIMSYHILSYPIISYHILSYRTKYCTSYTYVSYRTSYVFSLFHSLTTGFVSLWDEESERTQLVLLMMSLGRKNGLMWRQQRHHHHQQQYQHTSFAFGVWFWLDFQGSVASWKGGTQTFLSCVYERCCTAASAVVPLFRCADPFEIQRKCGLESCPVVFRMVRPHTHTRAHRSAIS